MKLDFIKIEFQNRGISLNSFRHETFYWKAYEKWVIANFGLKFYIYIYIYILFVVGRDFINVSNKSIPSHKSHNYSPNKNISLNGSVDT